MNKKLPHDRSQIVYIRRARRAALSMLGTGLATTLGANMFAAAAGAQEPVQGQLEEVVVTAQKREQSLQQVPISVTAFSAATLADMRISNVSDISNATPNFTLVPQGSSNTTYAVSMRGVGTSDTSLSSDSPIGIYVDGVAIPKNTGALFDAMDLERVEVLRGPQGTLYGRNTPAGAVNLISAKPTGEFGVDALVGFGKWNERDARLTINTPKLDLGGLGTISARLTGNYLKRDGWVRDVSSGNWVDSRDRKNGRLALRWTVSDDLTVDYAFTFTNLNELPPAVQMTQDVTGFFTPYVQPKRSTHVDLSIGHCRPNAPAPYGICNNTDVQRTTMHTLHAAWNVLPALTLKSITAYTGMYDAETTDYDGTPQAYLDNYAPDRFFTFSQELQASGSVNDGGLAYVTGLYYSKDHGHAINPGVYGFGTVLQYSNYSLEDNSKAVYGQVDWKPDFLDKKLTLSPGLRYTQETRKLLDAAGVSNGFVYASLAKASKDYSKLTPAFTIGYDFNDTLHGYLRYADGWRSGGFNGRASTNEALAQPFKQESLKAYEVGLKGSFFEKRLEVNTAVFYSKYQDLQIVQVEPTGGGGYASVNDNVGKINISGFEFELNALLTEKLKVSASYGYVDTDIKEFNACVPVGSPTCTVQNIGNNRLLYFNPRSNASISADYRVAETSYGTWKARVDANWRAGESGGASTIAYRPASADPGYIPSYGIVNAKIALEDIPTPAGHAEVYFWVKNLLDADTALEATDLTGQLGYAVARFIEPRTYGVEFGYHYR